MLILLWIFQIVLLNDFYKYIKINELKGVANELTKSTISFDSGFENSLTEKDICMSILSQNGFLIYSCNTHRPCAIHRMPQQLVYKLASDSLNKGVNFIDAKTANHLNFPNNILYVKSIDLPNNPNSIMILNSSIVPVSATVNTLRTQLFYITIIMVILSILLSFSLAKKLSTPIININHR